MKTILRRSPSTSLVLAVFFLCAFIEFAGAADTPPREKLLLDSNWRFHLGNEWGDIANLQKAGMNGGPAKRDFPDSGWRLINLPHDWAIELPFDPKSDTSHGFKPVGPGYPSNSVAWYRREFTLPKEDAGRRLWLEFDGVFRNCHVFLNGFLIGLHESGYTGFRYDITDAANCGGKNTIAVLVDASQFEGWFYEGAGIYRHVWLVKTEPVAIAPDGVFVYSRFKNNLPKGPAEVIAETTVSNSQNSPAKIVVRCNILGPLGRRVGSMHKSVTVEPWSALKVVQSTSVSFPELWSPESPQLYTLSTSIESDSAVRDTTETHFGIRTVAFDTNKGFLLNGNPVILKGTCNHQDHAGVGSALPDRLQDFRIERLREMGCNAYRTSHNPPTPELLDACDRLGMMVMDENRLLGSDAANMEELEGLVRRDRNHPSVVVWSIANEENLQTTPAANRIAGSMQRLVHQLDPTRSVTAAANVGNVHAGIDEVIDVRGWNYHVGGDMDRYHEEHPEQPNVGTEQSSALCTRGIYANDKSAGYMSAYDDNAPPWGHTSETWWKFFAARPWLSGGFVWTGFDYRGEPTPYAWPCINSHFGIMDTCGFPKDNFYFYQSWWTPRPVVHVLPHWNWPGHEGKEIDLRCFSNCEEVELFLNGRSLGRQAMPRNSHLQWKAAYEPGTLLAKGFNQGREICSDKVETTGAPAAVHLTPDRAQINADSEDISIVTVSVTDSQGRVVPVANNSIHFSLEGPGRILGVGNGDPSCHEADVYVDLPSSHSAPLDNWRMTRVQSTENRPETAADFSTSGWSRANVSASSGSLQNGQSAVYRARFTMSSDDLSSDEIHIKFGSIDDEGWVFVNGAAAGESHDWSASPSFNIRKLVHEGTNSVAVVVKNNDGAGGLSGGVSIDIQGKFTPLDWQRSAFNGLAQIIIQAGASPGDIKLIAGADGLKPAAAIIAAKPAARRPFVP